MAQFIYGSVFASQPWSFKNLQEGLDLCRELITHSDNLRFFAKVLDWDQFHLPKDFSMALVVEVAELVKHFQWLAEKQSFNLLTDKYPAH